MPYAKIDGQTASEYPIYPDELRARFPYISFPAGEFDPPDGYVLVATIDAPEQKPTENVFEVLPVLKDGIWTQTFVTSEASAEEIAERVMSAWVGIRQKRNQLLSSSDWTQLPDAPVDAAVWAEYRQALRDITDQEDPFKLVWPSEPGA